MNLVPCPLVTCMVEYDRVIDMARSAREKSTSGIFHVMMRGINKQVVFEDEEDKEKFLGIIERYKIISKYEIYGYCLMNNHIHMLLKENGESISAAIKRISSSYVYWYNMKYGRCGHLFQERFKSEIVENDAYLLTVLRYIHQNPVKAGLSKNAHDYRWSSYNEYIEKPVIANTDFILPIYSPNREKAISSIIEHTKGQNDDKCLDYDDKIQISDNEIKNHIEKLGINSMNELQQLDREKRNEIARKLKAIEGITIRQLSRVTGMSKSMIDRI